MIKNLGFLICSLFLIYIASSQPISKRPEIKVKKLLGIPSNGVRVAIDKLADRMYFITDNGDIYEVLNYKTNATYTKLASKTDHGIQTQLTGLLIDNGTMYISGSTDNGNTVTGFVKKANLATSITSWTTVAKSAPYLKSNTAFDHRMNSIAIDPTGQYLYLNSGSKSDHGETHIGERDVPLTAKIIRIPKNSLNLRLANNDSLNPYVYCRGTRNSFGLAFNAEGNLFGTENAGDRDHPEELNWLRQGHHYGFPWRLGGVNNPQQFDNYFPGNSNNSSFTPSADKFIQAASPTFVWVEAWAKGYFYNDPTFPAKPDTLKLIEPIINLGPDADIMRDTTDYTDVTKSKIFDASTTPGAKMTTFSPHLSPAGIIFDNTNHLYGSNSGAGYLVFYNGTAMETAFNADSSGGAFAQIKLVYDPSIDNYKTTVTNLVHGFNGPLGIEQNNTDLYVIEHDGTIPGIYKLSFEYSIPESSQEIIIDGKGNDADWNFASWTQINDLWIDNVSGNQNTMPSASNFSGRFKTLWKGSKLYILAEITDDIFDGKVPGDDPLLNYSEYDCLEVFINQSNSKAIHTFNNKAFALHISTQGDAVDLCGNECASYNGKLFNDIVQTSITGSGTVKTWEIAVTVYDSSYNESQTLAQNAGALVILTTNKMMGFSLAYNDSDGGHSRKYMIGSNVIPGTDNNTRNIAWEDASVFGQSVLTQNIVTVPSFNLDVSNIEIRSNRDTTITVFINSLTPTQEITYSVSPTVDFATVSVNGINSTISIHYSANKIGNQVFTITGNNGFYSLSQTFNVTVTSIAGVTTIPSGIVDKSIESRIEIYPNPATNKVTLNHIAGTNSVKLVDIQGAVKSEWVLSNVDKSELNLEALPKGFYMLYFATENYTFIKKLIIQ